MTNNSYCSNTITKNIHVTRAPAIDLFLLKQAICLVVLHSTRGHEIPCIRSIVIIGTLRVSKLLFLTRLLIKLE